MREKTKRAVSGLLAIGAIGGLTVGIADAAKSKKHHAKKSHKATAKRTDAGPGRDGHRGPPDATPLTGADADKAKAAALDAVPGATVHESFKVDKARDPSVVYVVEAAKSDGSPVLVLLDTDFKLVKVLDPPPFRHGGPGGPGGPHGGPPNEGELTGADADKAKAAALEAVPGGTVWRASKEDPAEDGGAAYEVHVRKSDNTEVEVLLDSDFKVIKTQAWSGPPGGPGGPHDGHHGPDGDGPDGDGPPPGAPGAGYPAAPPATTNS